MHFKISIITINKIQEKFDEIFNQRTTETLSRNLRATEFSNSIILFLMSLGLFTCSVNPKADKIYINGNILSGLTNGERLEYIATKDNIILDAGIGDYEHFIKSKTKIIDLNNKFVVPGFMDNHTHFMSGGNLLMSIDLHSANSKNQFIKQFNSYTKKINSGEWITGGNWDHENWGGLLPDKNWIDPYTKKNPVLVSRVDGHMALANSVALEISGITKDTPDPVGGVVGRDPKTGIPNGILKDNAIRLVSINIPEKSEEKKKRILNTAMKHAASVGITQIHDMCSWEDLETFKKNKNDLTLRIYAIPWYTNWEKLIQLIEKEGVGDDILRWNGIKAMVDGSLGSRTAWMHHAYLDDRNTSGLLIIDDTLKFKKMINVIDRNGIQLAVHAIGDKANDWIIDMFEVLNKKNGFRDRRLRIEHAQHLTESAIDKIIKTGIIPSMQPYGCIDDTRWMHKRIDHSLMSRSYIFKTFLDNGVNLTFGSDWDVTPLNPLEGIYAAVTRSTLDGSKPEGWFPDQKITVEDAIICYTKNNAYAGFQENKLGTIEKGKYADFVVLSDDITKIDPEDILDTYVLRTVVNAEDVYIHSN